MYNILAKYDKFYITDFIATKLNKKQFTQLQQCNDFLKDYTFIPFENTDFMWWSKTQKYLTKSKIVRAYFEIDFYGNVSKY